LAEPLDNHGLLEDVDRGSLSAETIADLSQEIELVEADAEELKAFMEGK
jgi:hypothetical protein